MNHNHNYNNIIFQKPIAIKNNNIYNNYETNVMNFIANDNIAYETDLEIFVSNLSYWKVYILQRHFQTHNFAISQLRI